MVARLSLTCVTGVQDMKKMGKGLTLSNEEFTELKSTAFYVKGRNE